MAQRTDDFNRSNSGSLGSLWSEEVGDAEILSNALTWNGNDGATGSVRCTTRFSTDHYSEVTVKQARTGSPDQFIGPTTRVSNADRAQYKWVYNYDNKYVRLERRDASGNGTIISSNVSYSVSLPFTLRLESEGTTHRGYINGKHVGTWQDSSIPRDSEHSYVGAEANNAERYLLIDRWSGGDLQAETFPTASVRPSGRLLLQPQIRRGGSLRPAGSTTAQRVVVRIFNASLDVVSKLISDGDKRFGGVLQPTGALIRVPIKRLSGSVRPAGAYRKSFVRIFVGGVSLGGVVDRAALGRVYGRPGSAALLLRRTGEAIARIREN